MIKLHFQNQTKQFLNQILIILTGFFISASYGLMLGWPSPTYPKLLSENSPIPITLPQTALIAGMLMDGYTLTIPLGGFKIIPCKIGLFLSLISIFLGWSIIYVSQNVLHLCMGRLLVGLGSGFGISKFKYYVKNIQNIELNFRINDYLPVFISFGVLTAYIFGPFLTFKNFAVMAAGTSLFSILPTLLLPQIKIPSNQKSNQNENKNQLIQKKNNALVSLFKNKIERKNLIIFIIFLTILQFSGAPAINVYSQIIFKEFGYSYPFIFCIIYMFLQVINTYLGIKFLPELKRKPVILVTLVILTFSTLAALLYLYFKPNGGYFLIAPIVVMCLYVTFHTAGLATLPPILISDLFEKKHVYVVNCIFQMYTAQLAVFITKIFQVFFTEYDMYVGFSFLTSVNCLGLIFVIFFFGESKKVGNTDNDEGSKNIETGVEIAEL